MTLQALDSEDLEGNNKVEVQARLIMADRNDSLLEQVISRLSLEPGVSAVSWKVVLTLVRPKKRDEKDDKSGRKSPME
jgi:putative Mg2+ transporter-C (MgtC) family protein